MKPRHFIVGLILLASLVGQSAGRPDPIQSKAISAQRLLRTQPARALAILDELHQQYPDNHSVSFMLASGWRRTGRLKEAESLLRELLAGSEHSQSYRSELALVLLDGGRDGQALQLLEPWIDVARPSAGDYQKIARVLQSGGRFTLARSYYERGLAAIAEDDERGRLMLLREILRYHAFEMDASAILLLSAREGAKMEKAANAERYLRHAADVLVDSAMPPSCRALADSLSASLSGDFLLPLLRQLRLALGDADSYVEETLREANRSGRDDAWLLDGAERLLKSGAADIGERRRGAENLIEHLLETTTAAPVAARARYLLADLGLRRDAERRLRGEVPTPADSLRLRRLLASVREVIPSSPSATEALLAEVRLLRERLGDAAAAQEALEEWLVSDLRGQGTRVMEALERELCHNLVALGRHEEARLELSAIRATTFDDDFRDWAILELARLDILAGNWSVAQDSLSQLALRRPASPVANDALDDALLLASASRWPAPARALLQRSLHLEHAGLYRDSAEILLTFVDDFPDEDPAPAFLARAAELFERALMGQLALESWLRLADSHPDHQTAPRALEMAARMALRLDDPALARRLVDRLTRDYPADSRLPGLQDLRHILREDPS